MIKHIQSLQKGEINLCQEVPNQYIKLHLLKMSIENLNILLDFVKLHMMKLSDQRLLLVPMNIPSGLIIKLPEQLVALYEQYKNGVTSGKSDELSKMPNVVENLVFFPSVQRAQVTALACTLPKDFNKPLSLWSATELAKISIEKGIVKNISPSTIKNWLREEKIKPWQYRSWQKSTDPRFLEKAIPILDLYEQAKYLARIGHIIVCVDEKTSIQARKLTGGVIAATRGNPVRTGDRYQRKGALQLFAGLLVSTGETIARCFQRKRFVEFQTFLHTVFSSLLCKNICCLHLIMDNGSTHAPKKIKTWIKQLKFPFEVKIHWLPVHASWLSQIEIIFSKIQKKVLKPNHFESTQNLEYILMNHFAESNKSPKPVKWSYTSAKLLKKFSIEALPKLVSNCKTASGFLYAKNYERI